MKSLYKHIIPQIILYFNVTVKCLKTDNVRTFELIFVINSKMIRRKFRSVGRDYEGYIESLPTCYFM
jgi:hypothetical protein